MSRQVNLNPDDLVHTKDMLYVVSESTLETIVRSAQEGIIKSMDDLRVFLGQDNFAAGVVFDDTEATKINLLEPPF